MTDQLSAALIFVLVSSVVLFFRDSAMPWLPLLLLPLFRLPRLHPFLSVSADALSSDYKDLPRQLNVALHEVAHVLGFSSSSWPLFREHDAARTPRTPRDEFLPHTVHSSRAVMSTCGGSTVRKVSIPSMDTVNVREVLHTFEDRIIVFHSFVIPTIYPFFSHRPTNFFFAVLYRHEYQLFFPNRCKCIPIRPS